MNDDAKKPQSENEGEGSRTAARDYNEQTRRFVERGQVDESARDAEQALDSPEADELKRAEEEGRSRSRGEDPALHR